MTSGRVLPEGVASLPLVLSSPSMNALQVPIVGVLEATMLKDPATKRQDEMRRLLNGGPSCEGALELHVNETG